MANVNTLGLLFSNMHDEVLRDSTAMRALGSVPFGGRYRLIDFALSNMVNAGISKVGVITKSHYQSLMDHLGSGKAWDLSRKSEGLFFLPPFGTSDEMYNGRISSLSEIEPFLRNSKEEYILLSDCNVVGNIDYEPLLKAHIDTNADITAAYRQGTSQMEDDLCLSVHENGRIYDMVFAHSSGKDGRYGIGLYVLRKDLLLRLIWDAMGRGHRHFERDILQRHVDNLQIYGFEISTLTMVISSLNAYFQANMSLLDARVRAQLFPPNRPIYTKVRDCPPALYGLHAHVSHSLVADGARIDGTVKNSVIFRDVDIGRDACVENAVIMQGTTVGDNASLGYVVLDKNVIINESRTLQGYDSYPAFIRKGSIV